MAGPLAAKLATREQDLRARIPTCRDNSRHGEAGDDHRGIGFQPMSHRQDAGATAFRSRLTNAPGTNVVLVAVNFSLAQDKSHFAI